MACELLWDVTLFM